MQRTLIAVFDNRGDAQSAIDALVASGFSRQQMTLSDADPTAVPAASTDKPRDEGLVGSITQFLSSMFGTDDSEYVQKYSDAVTRGHHVMTLTAADEPEVERAADIVERFGPVDIDEEDAPWGGGALAGDAVRMGAGAQQQQQPAPMPRQSMQGGAGAVQGAGQHASQQLAAGSAGAVGAAPVPVQRSSVKVFERLEEPGFDIEAETAEEIELYYRRHYNANFAGAGDRYDDYEPAYRYGADMASAELYRGRPWKDVEPALRSDWEGSNPGSAWAKMKAAVRHGWEKITS